MAEEAMVNLPKLLRGYLIYFKIYKMEGKMKKIFAVFYGFMLMFLLVNPGYAESTTIGVDDYPPFNFVSNNVAQGTNYDIVTESFKAMGVDVKQFIAPLERNAKSFNSRETQFLITTVPMAVASGVPGDKIDHAPFGDVVITFCYFKSHHNGKSIKWEKLEDLKQYKIGYLQGDGTGPIFQGKGLQMDVSTTLDAGLKKLYMKRIDILVGISAAMRYNVHRLLPAMDKDYAETDKPVATGMGEIIWWKNDAKAKELADKFKQGREIIKKNGTFTKILKKYYGNNPSKDILELYRRY